LIASNLEKGLQEARAIPYQLFAQKRRVASGRDWGDMMIELKDQGMTTQDKPRIHNKWNVPTFVGHLTTLMSVDEILWCSDSLEGQCRLSFFLKCPGRI
jgi:hypothetical protein